MNRAFIFPGQGSQIIGMGKDFYDEYPSARKIFEEVDDVLNLRLSNIIFNGPEETLTLTENTQSAIMAVSIAIFTILKGNRDIIDLCSYVAGHSLGEYSALCASGALSLKDTAFLLKIRGRSMQESTPSGVGAMAACLGIALNELEDIINQVKGAQVCDIANDNILGQIVISGHTNAVDAVLIKIKKQGFKGIKLKVSAPFHSSLMKPAEDIMTLALEKIIINMPKIPLITNISAKEMTSPIEIKQHLIKQICGRVRWRESLDRLRELGVDEIIEIGAGKILTNMIKKSGYSFKVSNISNVKELNDYINSL